MMKNKVPESRDEAAEPRWEAVTEGSLVTIRLCGDWTRETSLDFTLPEEAGELAFDAAALGKWNTHLAVPVLRLKRCCLEREIMFHAEGLPGGLQRLLVLGSAHSVHRKMPEDEDFLYSVGAGTRNIVRSVVSVMDFIGELVVSLCRALSFRSQMRWRDVFLEIYKAGPDALLIVSLIGFLMGLILAFIGAIPLKWFGTEIYVASLIGIGICRLMGAVMAGVVMAGRTGASYAAEIGTMQVNEEVDAMRSMGIRPSEYLVLPRFIALTLMMPMLNVFADVVGVLGGMAVGVGYLNLSVLEYWEQTVSTTRLNDFFVGVFTSFVFGILISICGCFRGLHCGRSSAAVGQATTGAVVGSIICLIISTTVITVLTVILNI